jgi:hypothetical protein
VHTPRPSGSSATSRSQSTGTASGSQSTGGAASSGSAATSPTTPATATATATATPSSAAALEARGHGLLLADRYGSAVPVLARAVLATGEPLHACIYPTGETCLTYAYALYDLGRALRLRGDPAAAVAILERRLQIDNQRSVVLAELRLARRQAARVG